MKTGFVFLSTFLAASLAAASPLPGYPFLFETGSAQIEVAPDLATVDLTVSDRGADAEKVFSLVNSSVATALDALARSKVPREDIDSFEIERSMDYSRSAQDKSAAPVRYVASRQVKIRLRDLSIWPALMADLAKIKNIENLNSEFHTSARNAIEAELGQRAARDAGERAKRSADSFGRKLGPAMAISRVPFNTFDRLFTEGAGSGYAPAAPYIPPMDSALNFRVPAKIRLSRSVNVLYKLD